ncbi:MAG: Flp pilus assembly protein TadD [Rhodothermales bacterium]|jgi:Flp pilus assembly protein TadD
MSMRIGLFFGLGVAVIIAVVVLRTPQEGYRPRPPGTVTYREHVAPILHAHCVGCHRPGQAGPFALLDYDDASSHAKQIREVTSTSLMPPWLPRRAHEAFANARGLNAEEIGLLGQWATDGTPEGDGPEPTPPEFTNGWQLGEPDLVVTLPESFALSADGADVYRNFVIPIPLQDAKWVRAFEVQPGNARVVHHIIMYFDETGAARKLDAQGVEPGFASMDLPRGVGRPGGHFLSWQPGRDVAAESEVGAWKLAPRSELVLQTHMQTTGKPETVQPQVGFYFTDTPPTQKPLLLSFFHTGIDIPAGATDYEVRMDYTLPVGVHAYGVLPHLHYLGKEVQGFATLPNGRVQWLVDIPQWDFNWQSDYRFSKPIALPAGTVITQRFTYDNSAANPRNPHDPPRRVTYGPETGDEMGEMWLQVVPDDPAQYQTLHRDNHVWNVRQIIEFKKAKLAVDPNDLYSAEKLAEAQLVLGLRADALKSFERALAIDPDHPIANRQVGNLYRQAGQFGIARTHLERSLRVASDGETHNALGDVLLKLGDSAGAQQQFLQAIRVAPELSQPYFNLGILSFQAKRGREAADHITRACELAPQNADYWANLGGILGSLRDFAAARNALERALSINPNNAMARGNLGKLPR